MGRRAHGGPAPAGEHSARGHAVDRIRLVIVDDDAAFVSALVSMLERDDRVEVVGTAANGLDALDVVARLRPNAVTMDLDMPVLDGIEATRRIVAADPGVVVVVVSASTVGEGVGKALERGAAAHVPKADVWDALVPTLVAAVARRGQEA
jgi:DNA-binding NarL/FixJ family response regulator